MSEQVPEIPQSLPETPEPVVPALPTDTRFDATPYAPEGGVNPIGLLMVLGGLAAAGILLGIGVYFVSQWFYLIILFPIIIGGILGVLGSFLVKKGRIRSPLAAGLAGFLGGLTAMGTTHYCNYLRFMEDIGPMRQHVQALEKMNIRNLPQMAGQQIDFALIKKMAKVETFWDYMDAEATQGVEFKRAAHGNGKGMNLGYTGTWIYWSVEALIVAGMVFFIARGAAQEPFCSVTGQWKIEKCGDNFAVSAELGAEGVGEMLKNGDLGHIALAKAMSGDVPVRLYVYASPEHNPQCSIDVKLVKFVTNKEGKVEEKEVAMTTYPHDALAAFEKLCS